MIFHKTKAPGTPGVYMERFTSRSKITMIKHNKKIRERKRRESKTPRKQRVKEERFNLTSTQ